MARRDTTTNLRDLRRDPEVLPDFMIEDLRRREEDARRRDDRPALELPLQRELEPPARPAAETPSTTVVVFDISSGVPI